MHSLDLPPIPSDPPIPRLRRLRILLSGEEPDARRIRDILAGATIELTIEQIPSEGDLEARLTSAPDLVMACEQGGLIPAARVLEITRQKAPRLPVIVFSASPTEEAALRAVELGAADYIQLERNWEVSVAVRRALREFEQRRARKEAEDRLRNHINLLQLQQVVAAAANEALSPRDAAQSVLDITRAYGNFVLGHLFYASGEDPSEVSASGIWSGYEAQTHSAFRDKTEGVSSPGLPGMARIVLQSGELLWVSDISAEPRFNRAGDAAGAGLRSVVMAPVAAGAETLGVIEFFSAEPKPRDEHLALVIEYVATQLGRVFERERSERRLESRAREQMVLAELSRKAVDVVNLDEFLDAAVSRVEDVLEGCRCAVLEATPDGAALRVRVRPVVGKLRDRFIPAATAEDIGHAVLHTDVLKLNLRTSTEWKIPRFARRQAGTALTASIRLRKGVFGALVAYCGPECTQCEFSRSETSFLRSVANLLATAAEHAAAFQQLQLLGSAVTQSHDAIMITDADLEPPGPRILFINPAFTQITGYGIDEILGFSPRILQGPKTSLDFLRRTRARLGKGKSVQGETVNYRKDGSEYWAELQISPLRNSTGEITHFVGIQRDITERKNAEERLRESEAVLGAAQRLAHLGSWVLEYCSTDPEKGKLLWSEEVFRIFGFAPGGIEVSNEAFFRAVHPDDRSKVAEAFNKAVTGRTEYQIDHRILRPDGVQRIVHEQATAIYDEAGHPVKVLGTVQDITERKRAEEELSHWKERYETLTKASGQIIFDWDYVSGLITFGGDIERVLGYPPETIGRTMEEWTTRIHPEDRAHFEHELDRQAHSKTATEIEYRLRRKDGTYITVRRIGYPMLDKAGAIKRIIGSIKDVSTERALELQLRQSQKMEAFGKLAGGVAHDFNNLLTVITGYNDVVLNELAPTDPKREYIEQIAEAANRAGKLTSQLLAFSRQQKLQPRVINLNDVLCETSKMLCRLIGEDITMVIEETPGLGNVKADVGQLEQVLMNLAINARDAMPGGGALRMSARNASVPGESTPAQLPPGQYVLLEVSDTGMGMPPEVQARILSPSLPPKGLAKAPASAWRPAMASSNRAAAKSPSAPSSAPVPPSRFISPGSMKRLIPTRFRLAPGACRQAIRQS